MLYSVSTWHALDNHKPVFCLYMFQKLLTKHKHDLDDLLLFSQVESQINRKMPDHNWLRGFAVTKHMFIVETRQHRLTPVQCRMLHMVCLCYDLDNFMVQIASKLAVVNTTSPIEHHHINQTVTIQHNEGNNIFKYLASDEQNGALKHLECSQNDCL